MASNKDLIGYCGLYCGDCFGYKEKIADLARDLRKELRDAKFDRISKAMPFKEFKDYEKSYALLGALVRLRCKKACRGGGGNPYCKIRKCCQKKSFNGCWECDKFEGCKKLDELTVAHLDGHIKNLKKLKKHGQDEFVKGKRHW
jgi:hypothetical protein